MTTAAVTAEGRPVKAKPATMAQALGRALRDAMAEDPTVHVLGEDVGTLGGVFRITDGLAKEFGDDRCTDTPLAEAGILGAAVGMAMYGLRPVVEMQFDAFAYPAFEQLMSHVAKMRNRTGGAMPLPITVRVPYGGGIGGVEHHSDSSEAYYMATPACTSSRRPRSTTRTGCCGSRSPRTTRWSSLSPSGSTGPRPTGRPRPPPRSSRSARPWCASPGAAPL